MAQKMTLEALFEEFSGESSKAQPNHTPYTFMTADAWIAELWRTYGDGRTLISTVQRQRRVRELLVAQTVCDGAVTDTGTTAAEAADDTDDTDAADGTDTTTTRVAEIAQRYHDALIAEERIDAATAVMWLATHAPKLDTDVVVVGVETPCIEWFALLRAVAAASDIYVAALDAGNAVARAYAERILAPLGAEPCGDTDGRKVPSEPLGALKTLVQHYHTAASDKIVPDSTTKFRLARGSEAEIATVVDEVTQTRIAHPTWRIAVAIEGLEQRLLPLTRALDRAGQTYGIDVSLPFTATECGAAVQALLVLATGELEPLNLAAYAESPCARLDPEVAVALDTQLRTTAQAAQRLRGRAAIEFVLEEGARALAAHRGARCEGAPVDLPGVEDVDPNLTLLLSCLSDKEDKIWRTLFDSLLVAPVSPTPLQEIGNPAAHRVAIQVLEELADLSENRITPRTLLTTLQTTFVPLNAPWQAASVVLTTPQRLAGLTCDALILAGTDARTYALAADIGSRERVLQELGYPTSDTEWLRYTEILMLAAPRECLTLIYQDQDDEADDVPPSGLLEEIASHLDIEFDIVAKNGKTPLSVWDSPETLAILFDDSGTIPVPKNAVQRLSEPQKTRSFQRGGAPIVLPANRTSWAITQLEKYAKCPYHWFLVSAVGGREFDKAVGFREVGTLTHFILEQTFTVWARQGGGAIGDEEALNRLIELFESTVEHLETAPLDMWERKRNQRNVHNLRMMCDLYPEWYLRVLHNVRVLIEAELVYYEQLAKEDIPELVPTAFEHTITEQDSVSIEGLRVHGSADRIDANQAGDFVVLDYKGGIPTSNVKIRNERHIQAAIYVLALLECADVRFTCAHAFFYRSYNNGLMRFVADMNVLNEVREIVREVGAAHTEGVIKAPTEGAYDPHLCEYCPHVHCPVSHGRRTT
ncbi:MAG: PD-(D/E)XK nuclease family protein [Coriobacteriia bacterium]|nr:PD-(D/E)XK nuclease family protein [Coriobacteriia bacterium]